LTKRRFFLEGKPDTHLDHFVVVGEGKLADLAPKASVAEGAELQIELVEVDRHDASAAVGKLDGIEVCIGGAAELVGKRVRVRIERVLDGTAYGSLVKQKPKVEPLTAEAEAEKPTRRPPARKTAEADLTEAPDAEEEAPSAEAEPSEPADEAAPAKKKTRRGSRRGKGRKKATIHLPPDDLGEQAKPEEQPSVDEAPKPEAQPETEPVVGEEPSENGAAPKKKKTRRGSRGGKNRRKRAAAAVSTNGAEPAPEPDGEPEPAEDWGYVPMSEWGDEFEG
jgi:hypothetical protein